MVEQAKPESLIKLKTESMPYGKYKGVILIDLPEPYVVWIYENQRPEGQFGLLFQELYEIKVNGLESLVKDIKIMIKS